MKRHYSKALLGTICMVAFALTVTADAFAHHKPGHHPPGHSKKYKKYKKHHKKHHRRSHSAHHGDPPAWAPAWGYRGKRKVRYERSGIVYEADPTTLVRIPEVGLGECNRDIIGAVLGGAVGAAAGSQIGKGDGRTLATIGGAIIGALVGGNIGRSMDQVDQNCVGQVLERTPNGKTVVWNNPDRNGEYRVTPTRTYQTRGGTYCRDYQTKIVIDGRLENAYGTACRQPDGTWKKA